MAAPTSIQMGSIPLPNPTTPPSTGRPSTSTNNSIHTSLSERPLTAQEIEEKPWKYIGYKGYTEFASENDFFIARRFTALNARVLLALQDQVAALEGKLRELDERYSRRDAEDLHNGSFRDDRDDRTLLVEEIYQALTRYNAFLLQQAQLQKYPEPFRQDLKSVKNWHDNHGNIAISAEEQEYLRQTNDIISVIPKHKTPLRRLLDRSRNFRIHPLWHKAFDSLPIYDQDVITYTSDQKIEKFITVITITVGMVMLIVPMWILHALASSNQSIQLAVITAFIVAFLGLLSYATTASPGESLGATAAYSAVLMVFLQLGGTGS